MTYVANQGPASSTAIVIDISAADLPGKLAEAMGVYVAAMGYSAAHGTQRGVQAVIHSRYEHFRCRAAVSPEGSMLGIAYGYTSLPGQWWHDLVARAVGRQASGGINGAFELSELHVLPRAQGAGIGERLLRSLAAELPHTHMVLSTPEGENRAWRLYRRLGFADLARNHMFPGDNRPFGVLGADLPFPG